MVITKKLPNQRQNLKINHPKVLQFITPAVLVFLVPLFVSSKINAAPITPKSFVYTEVQNSVPFKQVPWKKRNPVISSQPGFMYKTMNVALYVRIFDASVVEDTNRGMHSPYFR